MKTNKTNNTNTTVAFNFDMTNPIHIGMYNTFMVLANQNSIPSQVVGDTTVSTDGVKEPKSKRSNNYEHTKDLQCKYKIQKLTGTTESGETKELYCISRANGWTKAEKKAMNNHIKELKGITEIKVQVDFTFKAWGYNTEATAKKHLKELPTVITKEELNNTLV